MRVDSDELKVVTLTGLGNALGAVMPTDYVRALGWTRGDKLCVYIQKGNIVFRNSSERAVRFTRAFKKRSDDNLESDTR